jgi:hypothetical protein
MATPFQNGQAPVSTVPTHACQQDPDGIGAVAFGCALKENICAGPLELTLFAVDEFNVSVTTDQMKSRGSNIDPVRRQWSAVTGDLDGPVRRISEPPYEPVGETVGYVLDDENGNGDR